MFGGGRVRRKSFRVVVVVVECDVVESGAMIVISLINTIPPISTTRIGVGAMVVISFISSKHFITPTLMIEILPKYRRL